MTDFILARAKAFIAALIPALVYAALTTIEDQFGIIMGDETKIMIASIVTGGMVHQVPNRSV